MKIEHVAPEPPKYALKPGQLWRRKDGIFAGAVYLAVSLYDGDKIELISLTENCTVSWTAGDSGGGFGHVGQAGFEYLGTLEYTP